MVNAIMWEKDIYIKEQADISLRVLHFYETLTQQEVNAIISGRVAHAPPPRPEPIYIYIDSHVPLMHHRRALDDLVTDSDYVTMLDQESDEHDSSVEVHPNDRTPWNLFDDTNQARERAEERRRAFYRRCDNNLSIKNFWFLAPTLSIRDVVNQLPVNSELYELADQDWIVSTSKFLVTFKSLFNDDAQSWQEINDRKHSALPSVEEHFNIGRTASYLSEVVTIDSRMRLLLAYATISSEANPKAA